LPAAPPPPLYLLSACNQASKLKRDVGDAHDELDDDGGGAVSRSSLATPAARCRRPGCWHHNHTRLGTATTHLCSSIIIIVIIEQQRRQYNMELAPQRERHPSSHAASTAARSVLLALPPTAPSPTTPTPTPAAATTPSVPCLAYVVSHDLQPQHRHQHVVLVLLVLMLMDVDDRLAGGATAEGEGLLRAARRLA